MTTGAYTQGSTLYQPITAGSDPLSWPDLTGANYTQTAQQIYNQGSIGSSTGLQPAGSAATAPAASTGANSAAGTSAPAQSSGSVLGAIEGFPQAALNAVKHPLINFGFAMFGAVVIVAAVFAWRPVREAATAAVVAA